MADKIKVPRWLADLIHAYRASVEAGNVDEAKAHLNKMFDGLARDRGLLREWHAWEAKHWNSVQHTLRQAGVSGKAAQDAKFVIVGPASGGPVLASTITMPGGGSPNSGDDQNRRDDRYRDDRKRRPPVPPPPIIPVPDLQPNPVDRLPDINKELEEEVAEETKDLIKGLGGWATGLAFGAVVVAAAFCVFSEVGLVGLVCAIFAAPAFAEGKQKPPPEINPAHILNQRAWMDRQTLINKVRTRCKCNPVAGLGTIRPGERLAFAIAPMPRAQMCKWPHCPAGVAA